MPKFGQSIAGQTSKYAFLDIKQDDAKYSGIPNGKYYFILGFGFMQTLAKKEPFTYEKHLVAEMENDTIVPYNKCQLIVKVSKDERKFTTWHFTGETDPLVKLGYAQKNGYSVERTAEQITRLGLINGFSAGFNKYHEFAEARFHVPTWRVELNDEDELDASTMKPTMLSLTNGQLKNLVTSFSALAMEKNKNPFGYAVLLIKDKSKGKDAYQWTTLPKFNFASPERIVEIQELITWNTEKLDKIYQEANGGEINSENVWNYLCTTLQMSREDIYKHCNINLSSSLVEVSSVSLNNGNSETDIEGMLEQFAQN